MKADLHMHSEYSDGKDTVSAILNNISKHFKGAILSFTEHNNFFIKESYSHKGNTCIPGIEISSQSANDSFHLLAYSHKVKTTPELDTMLSKIVNGYDKRALKIHNKLNSLGYIVPPLKELRNQKLPSPVYSYDFISYFTKYLKLKSDKQTRKWLHTNGNLLYIKEDNFLPEPRIVIRMLKKLGYVVVLAHPGMRLLVNKETRKKFTLFLDVFVQAGLDGLEVFYPKHTKSQIKELLTISKKYNLAVTGGSDYHGEGRTAKSPLIDIPEKYIRDFKRRIERL